YRESYSGKEVIKPFVQVAKDPQRAVNYSVSENANAMKRAQYAKILHTMQQSKGFEKYYNNNNSSSRLPYTFVPGVPQPTIIPPTPVSGIYMQSFNAYSSMLQFVIGMHDSAIGAQGLERSGVALGHEIRQSNQTNFTIIDNVYRTIEVIGKLILELFPSIYDSTRGAVLTGADGAMKTVTLNQPNGCSLILIDLIILFDRFTSSFTIC
ncbi:unnamed protein product, partial [marine sediment metagenome]